MGLGSRAAFGGEGIVHDDLGQFFCAAHEEVSAKIEASGGLRLEQAFKPGARSRVAAENQVATLQQRSHVLQAERGCEVAQSGHRNRLTTGHIDGAKQRDSDRHD